MTTLHLRTACAVVALALAGLGCNRQENPPTPPKSLATSQGTTPPDTGHAAGAPPAASAPGTASSPAGAATPPGQVAMAPTSGPASSAAGAPAPAPEPAGTPPGGANAPPAAATFPSDQRGMAGVAGSSVGPVSGTDRAFVSEAANNGLAEVEASRLVAARSDNPDVKSMAQHMEQDHSAINDDLKRIAAQKGIDLPTTIGGEPRGQLSRLSTLSKPEVDGNFVRDFGVSAHEKAVNLFEREAREGQDPDLKAFAERTLPKLQQHLAEARRMQGTQVGQAAPAGPAANPATNPAGQAGPSGESR